MRALAWFGVCAGLLAACGGAADSPLFGGPDGGSGSDGGGGGDGPASCDMARCPSIPDGFQPVRLAQSKSSCPAGWSESDVVSQPTAGDGACSCACNVTNPTCDTGTITRTLDNTSTPTCGSAGASFLANQGGCSPTNLGIGYPHYQVNAPPPSGGSCTWDAHVDTSKVASSPAVLCSPPASCQGAICDGPVCVSHDGDVDCPAPFSNKTLVGTSATADCGACPASCTIDAKCTGTLKFFTDQQCSQGEVDFTADGTCADSPTSVYGPYYSYSYVGSVDSATCAGTPPTATATAKLDGATTVCCQ
jgi:hypothetical protein